MTEPTHRKISKKWLIGLPLVAVLMFGFGFALVPLYSVFCAITGLNGKTGGAVVYNDEVIDESRVVKIEFMGTKNNNMPWDFYPLQSSITVHPGEKAKIAFYAKNKTSDTMVVQAIPSVSPGQAAKYLQKTECFCFTSQTFKAGESLVMPVLFHLDKDFPKDIDTITLSYTLFDIAGIGQTRRTKGRIS